MVAVAIAKLGEAAVVGRYTGGGSFIGTGRALSAAAGRLSYVYGLKVSTAPGSTSPSHLHMQAWDDRTTDLVIRNACARQLERSVTEHQTKELRGAMPAGAGAERRHGVLLVSGGNACGGKCPGGHALGGLHRCPRRRRQRAHELVRAAPIKG